MMSKRKRTTPVRQPAKGKRYDQQVKNRAVKFARKNGVTAAAREFNVSPPTLYRWRDLANAPAHVHDLSAPVTSDRTAGNGPDLNFMTAMALLGVAVTLLTADQR